MRTDEIVVSNVDGIVHLPVVARSARARQARAANAIRIVNEERNPGLDATADENERIARDEATIDNLRDARRSGDHPDAWYDPYDPLEAR